MIGEFVKKENIQFQGTWKAEILLGRDTRPSGESLLEAAKQVWLASPSLPFYRNVINKLHANAPFNDAETPIIL